MKTPVRGSVSPWSRVPWYQGILKIGFGLLSILMLVPFLNVASLAVSEGWAVTSGRVGLFPVGFQVETLGFVLLAGQYLPSLMVSVMVTAAGTALALFVTVLAAYPLSKPSLPGRRFLMVVFVFTMMFSGGLIPSYMLVKSLGLMNSPGALILPLVINVFNLLVFKSHFESLPESLEESASLEGATSTMILFQILIPLSGPMLATVGLFFAVGFWNDFFSPLLYISSPTWKPLQLYLREVLTMMSDAGSFDQSFTKNVVPEGVRAALVIMATLPIVLVYPFLQKYFTKGVLIGSIKG